MQTVKQFRKLGAAWRAQTIRTAHASPPSDASIPCAYPGVCPQITAAAFFRLVSVAGHRYSTHVFTVALARPSGAGRAAIIRRPAFSETESSRGQKAEPRVNLTQMAQRNHRLLATIKVL